MKIRTLLAHFPYKINRIKFWKNSHRCRKDTATGLKRHENIWASEEWEIHLFYVYNPRFWVSCIPFSTFRQTVFPMFMIHIQRILKVFLKFYLWVMSLGNEYFRYFCRICCYFSGGTWWPKSVNVLSPAHRLRRLRARGSSNAAPRWGSSICFYTHCLSLPSYTRTTSVSDSGKCIPPTPPVPQQRRSGC